MANSFDLNDLIARDALTVQTKDAPAVVAARLEQEALDAEVRRKKELWLFGLAVVLVAAFTIFAMACTTASDDVELKKWSRDLLFLVVGGALTALGIGKLGK